MIRRFLCACSNKECICEVLVRYDAAEIAERMTPSSIGKIYKVDKTCFNCTGNVHNNRVRR